MNVLGIGESTIDITRFDHNTPTGARQTLDTTPHVGGVVTAALVVLARLGANCTLFSSLGDDAEGQRILHTLTSEGITPRVQWQARTKINTMVVEAASGLRTGKLRSKVQHMALQQIDRAVIRQADIIIIDRHEQQAFYEIMQHKRPATSVIIDPSTELSDFTLEMIGQAEHPVVPIETLTQLPATDLWSALDALHEICQKPLTVTAGAMGSVLYNGTVVEVIPALDLQAVDSSGAGDVYRGAYAYGVLQNWGQRRSARFANTIAGLQCQAPGNISAIPSRADMRRAARLRPAKLKQVLLCDINSHYKSLRAAQANQSSSQGDTV
jgi:sugar/nucleoside kinase (ribokinase family)